MTEKIKKIVMAQSETANSTLVWILFLFFGWSYGSLGKIGLQILYYITLGGCGIWTIYRLFTLNSAIRDYNNTIYVRYRLIEMVR